MSLILGWLTLRVSYRVVFSILASVKASELERFSLLLSNKNFNEELFVMYRNQVKNLCVVYRNCVKALFVGYRIFIKDLPSFFMTELLGWNKTDLTFFLARSCIVRSR